MTNKENLMQYDKATLVDLLIKAVENGNEIELKLREFEGDRNVRDLNEMADEINIFLSKSEAVAYQDDLTVIVLDRSKPRHDYTLEKFKNLDINPILN